jgi:hypothetical protein
LEDNVISVLLRRRLLLRSCTHRGSRPDCQVTMLKKRKVLVETLRESAFSKSGMLVYHSVLNWAALGLFVILVSLRNIKISLIRNHPFKKHPSITGWTGK